MRCVTHSLEVSSVARNMAQEVGSWLFQMGHLKQDDVGALSSIAATCGLIHDIGNPPFGHAGELAIQSWFEKKCPNSAQGQSEFFQADVTSQLAQDFLRFNGNPHMLRLVACLQVLADYRGMNLTCGTLSAACKYLAPSNALTKEVHERSRTGFFLSEEDLVQRIRAETGTGEARNPITYLVEASDDIVYSVVDLEDGVKKGAISWEDLRREFNSKLEGSSPEFDRAIQACNDLVGSATSLT